MKIKLNKLTKMWEVRSDLFGEVLFWSPEKIDCTNFKKSHSSHGFGYGN